MWHTFTRRLLHTVLYIFCKAVSHSIEWAEKASILSIKSNYTFTWYKYIQTYISYAIQRVFSNLHKDLFTYVRIVICIFRVYVVRILIVIVVVVAMWCWNSLPLFYTYIEIGNVIRCEQISLAEKTTTIIKTQRERWRKKDFSKERTTFLVTLHWNEKNLVNPNASVVNWIHKPVYQHIQTIELGNLICEFGKTMKMYNVW